MRLPPLLFLLPWLLQLLMLLPLLRLFLLVLLPLLQLLLLYELHHNETLYWHCPAIAFWSLILKALTEFSATEGGLQASQRSLHCNLWRLGINILVLVVLYYWGTTSSHSIQHVCFNHLGLTFVDRYFCFLLSSQPSQGNFFGPDAIIAARPGSRLWVADSCGNSPVAAPRLPALCESWNSLECFEPLQ